ncbi:unnamed protein product [Malus baccata var. baccata]
MLSRGGGCSRLSPHLRLRDSSLHLHLHHPQLGFGFVFIFGLGFYNTRIAHLRCYPCPPPLKPLPLSSALSHSHTRAVRFSSIFPSSKSSSPDIPALPHCFSQREDERELPPEGLSSVAGGIVALGKFDALDIGHRELAVQASKVGHPFLCHLLEWLKYWVGNQELP